MNRLARRNLRATAAVAGIAAAGLGIALQHLDAAATAGRLAEQVLSGTQGNDIRPAD